MRRFIGKVRVGLRDKDTGELIRVYPDEIEGEDREVINTVNTWFYEKGCPESEDMANKYYVDNLTDQELKNYIGTMKSEGSRR